MLKVLKVFYKYYFNKKSIAAVFIFLIILTPLVESIEPIFYKNFVDTISVQNYQKLFHVLTIFIIYRVLSSLLPSSARHAGAFLIADSVAEVKKDAVKRIQDLDFAFHTQKVSGALVNRIKRGSSSFWDFDYSIHFQIVDVLVNFGVMLYFFKSLDFKIFGLAILSLVFSFALAKFFVSKNIGARRLVNESEDKITGVIVDNLVNFETVKVFAKENFERERLAKKFKFWERTILDFLLTFRFLELSLNTLINASIFLILLVSVRLVSSGAFTVGEFVLVIGFLGAFYPKLFQLIFGIRRIAQDYTDVEKLVDILYEPIRVKDPKNPVQLKSVTGEIEFASVSFKYEKDEKEAVKNINLKIRQGQSVALVGSSGAGKTTMVKLLMRFFDVDEGKITIDGVSIKNFTKSDLRSFMGVVPQEPILFNNTIGYNIAYGKKKATKKEIIAAAKLANIHDFIAGLPKGYETQVGERGIKLSGGQKQRVAIARMILSNPDIIIFDEATSQLDSESERLIQAAFWKAREAKTTILIAHRLSTVSRADKIVVMEDGRIVETGSHNELLRVKNGKYRHFWELQTDID